VWFGARYDCWFVAKDTSAAANTQAAPTRVDVTTTADVTPPTFSSGFPAVSDLTDTTFTLSVHTNEPGAAFFVVIRDGDATPSVSEVRAGTAQGGAEATAFGSMSLTSSGDDFAGAVEVSGLIASTAYTVCVVAHDTMPVPNMQAAITTNAVTMAADTTPPLWIGLHPSATAVRDFAFNLTAKLHEPATVFYAVLAHGAPAPTVVDVRAGTDGVGDAAKAAGSFAVATADTVLTTTVASGLTAATTFDVYLFAEVRCRCVHCMCCCWSIGFCMAYQALDWRGHDDRT